MAPNFYNFGQDSCLGQTTMRKVGQPSAALFKSAKAWYSAASSQAQFLEALKNAELLTASATGGHKTAIDKSFSKASQNFSASTEKLEKRFRENVLKHFASKGVEKGSLIRLSYPIYVTPEPGSTVARSTGVRTAVLRVLGFNFKPQDEQVPEDRFRVVGHPLDANGVQMPQSVVLPFDKRCSYEVLPEPQ